MIVAPYTPGNRYEHLAHQCADAWKRVGVDIHLQAYVDRARFDLNCLAFTLAAAELWDASSREPLLIIGVDTLPNPHVTGAHARAIMQHLELGLRGLLTGGPQDVVCEYRPGRQLNMRVHSGVVGWADNSFSRKWFAEHCRRLRAELHAPKPRNDQEILFSVLLGLEAEGGRWQKLPEGFNCKDTGSLIAPIIHGHASRGNH